LKTDSLFHRLFQTRPQLLFDLLGSFPPDASAYQFQSVELKVYKMPALSREEIQRMIGLPEVDLKQTRFYQDVFTEGRQEGRQEGLQEGRQEEALALVLRLLRRRLGNLDATVESRLAALTLPQIEALADALLDFTTVSDLETWLG
jgi:predicted transposase YdaD